MYLLACLFFCSEKGYCANRNWRGTTSAAWNVASNWVENAVPVAGDAVFINVNTTYTNAPVVGAALTTPALLSVTFGPANAQLTVNGQLNTAGVSVNFTGFIATANTRYTVTIGGTGTLNCTGNVQIGDGTAPANGLIGIGTLNGPLYYRISSQVNNFLIGGNIILASVTNAVRTGVNFPEFFLDNNDVVLDGQIVTQNTGQYNGTQPGPTSAIRGRFSLDNTTNTTSLTLNNAAAIPAIAAGQVVDFTDNGTGTCSVIYNGSSAQRVYTNGSDTRIGVNNCTYDRLVFSGAGTKTVDAGNLSIGGSFDNTANSPADFVTNSTNFITYTNVINSPASTRVVNGGTTGTTFYRITVTTNTATGSDNPNLNATALGPIIIQNRVNIAPTGYITLDNGSSLTAQTTAADFLTLKSNASGSASVATIPDGSAVTGIVNVERYMTSSYGRGYRLISSPVNNTTVSGDANYFTVASLMNSTLFGTNSTLITGPTGNGWDLSRLNNPSAWVYREADPFPGNSRILDSDYKGILTATTPIPVGSGLLFFNRGNRNNATAKLYGSPFPAPEDYAITFRGNLNQGTVQARVINNNLNNFNTTSTFNPATRYYYAGSMAPTVNTLNYTNNPGTANINTNGLNLVGNPYASVVDLDAITVTNASANLYFFNPSNKQWGVYQKGSGGMVAVNDASRYLASGQGFFVRANNNTATVSFAETNKTLTPQPTPGGTPVLLMGKPVTASQMPRILLQMIKDSIDYDGVGIYVYPDAKDGNDDLDAQDLDGISPQVYLSAVSADGQRMAIDMLAPLDGTKKIPLYVNSASSGLFSLVKTELEAIPPVYDVWLMDRMSADSLDLRANSEYRFRISKTDSSSFGDQRFEIHIRRKNLPPYQLVSFTGEMNQGKPLLKWNALNDYAYVTYTLQRQNESGFGAIYERPSAGLGAYMFSDTSARSGSYTYRLRQTDAQGKVTFSEPVTVSMLAKPAGASSSVYPNPATRFITIHLDERLQATQLRILDLGGRVLLSVAVSGNDFRQNIAPLKPGMYVAEIRVIQDGKISYRRHSWIKASD